MQSGVHYDVPVMTQSSLSSSSSSSTPGSTQASAYILIVSANDEWGQSLNLYLQRNGYAARLVRLMADALQYVREQRPSCLVIDRSMPGMAPIRAAAAEGHLPLVTVQVSPPSCTEEEYLSDYAAGSDAVICTGSPREMLARLRALLRREQFRTIAPLIYRVGDIEMNVPRHEVRVRGTLVDLTRKEFQLLERLLGAPQHVFTRQELMDHVWGENYALEPHGVDVHISALRRKLEQDPGAPQVIVTVRGHGYKIRA